MVANFTVVNERSLALALLSLFSLRPTQVHAKLTRLLIIKRKYGLLEDVARHPVVLLLFLAEVEFERNSPRMTRLRPKILALNAQVDGHLELARLIVMLSNHGRLHGAASHRRRSDRRLQVHIVYTVHQHTQLGHGTDVLEA